MTNEPDRLEIEAYVDGQLDTGRRFVVEDHLSRHPSLAARVMADLATRSGLRLLSAPETAVPGAMATGAARLAAGRAPVWRRPLPMAAAAAICVGLVATFAIVAAPDGPPGYVDYALSSHRITMLRAGMVSQVETPRYDAREIATTTRIAMPQIPLQWHVLDVQLFPTDKGPALVVAVRTQAGEALSLFAVHQRSDAPERPDAVREGTESVAYWRRGDMSYALTGSADPVAMDATAEKLVGDWT